MSDIDAWLYFDGPEPEYVRPLLAAIRDLPPATPEDRKRRARRFSEMLNAELARQGESSGATGAAVERAPIPYRAGAVAEVGEDGATRSSPSLDERPAGPPPVDQPSPPAGAEEARLAVERSIEEMKITAVLDVPAELRAQMGWLPFKPHEPGAELSRTMQVPVLNPKLGQTAPLGDDSIAKAVALLPFGGNTVGAALVPFPRLPLEAYASLRAELSMWPERSVEILARYHVMNEAARRALEEHWEVELAARPEERAMFDKRLAEYTAWLRTRGV